MLQHSIFCHNLEFIFQCLNKISTIRENSNPFLIQESGPEETG